MVVLTGNAMPRLMCNVVLATKDAVPMAITLNIALMAYGTRLLEATVNTVVVMETATPTQTFAKTAQDDAAQTASPPRYA